MAKITFYGGVGSVTGSKYLLESNGRRVLVDCGLFQGLKELREKNWEDPPFRPAEIDAVIITHAHIDHTGIFAAPRQARFFRKSFYFSRNERSAQNFAARFGEASGRRSRLSQSS